MAKKQSTDAVNREWIKKLNTEKIKPLYIMYGEEVFRRDSAIGIIKKRLVPEELSEFNYIELDGKGLKFADLSEAVDGLPIMSERKLIVVRNYDIFKNPTDEIIALISNIPDEVCLIFIYDGEDFKPDKRTKMYALVSKKGETANFTAASPSELRDWIRRKFADMRKNIENQQIDYLMFVCGTDMYTLINEISKVAAYARYAMITNEDIDAVTSRCIESKVFELCDNIAAGKGDRALRALEDMMTLRESAVMVCAMIGRQMRQLYITKLAVEDGKNLGYINELFGFRYSFQGEKLMDPALSLPLYALRDCTILCCEADLKLKSSKQDDYDIVKILILNIINAVKKK